MRLVITGAGGFLGREIVRQAAPLRDFDVVAISTNPDRLRDDYGVEALSANEFVAKDKFLRDVDVVINCAFPRNEDSFAMPAGLGYVRDVLRKVASSRHAALINVSSQSVYSQRRACAATESTPVCLESKYAVAKYGVEMLVDAYCAHLAHTNIRLASLIGPGFDQRLPNKFVKKALSGQDIVISDKGFRYGYMSVFDAADALLRMAASDSSSWEPVYNLGSRGTATVPDMARWANASVMREGFEGVKVSESSDFEENPINTDLDSTLFETQFEWAPRYTIEKEIARIARFEIGGWDCCPD